MSDSTDEYFRRHRDVGKSVRKHALLLLLISLCIFDWACLFNQEKKAHNILTDMPSFSIFGWLMFGSKTVLIRSGKLTT